MNLARALILLPLVAVLSACADRPPIALATSAQCRALSPVSPALYHHALTSIPTRYKLERLDWASATPRYRATLNVSFRSPAAPELAERVRVRTNACLAALSPKLGGPQGEQLEIVIGPEVSFPPPADIEVTPLLVRGHSRLWQANWGCAEIVHEVFHLVGLVDEYEEKDGGKFDCRAVGPASSIMTAPAESYRAVSPKAQLVQCFCPPEAPADCFGKLERAFQDDENLKACPGDSREWVQGEIARTAPLSRDPIAVGVAGVPTEEAELRFLGSGKNRFVREVAPERANLLFPAQFAAIVFPDCGTSSVYQRCAQNAYRSSARQGCLTDRPAECGGGSLDWMKLPPRG